MLNNRNRAEILQKSLNNLKRDSMILDVSDGSYFTMIGLEMGLENMFSLEIKKDSMDFYYKVCFSFYDSSESTLT